MLTITAYLPLRQGRQRGRFRAVFHDGEDDEAFEVDAVVIQPYGSGDVYAAPLNGRRGPGGLKRWRHGRRGGFMRP